MKVAVILGNRMNDDGTPSETMLKRIELASKLYSELKPDYMILAGGLANKKAGKTEAESMFDLLTAKKIPSDILIKETRSLTTVQNAKFSVPIALTLKTDTLIVCTSKEHMTRKYLNPMKFFRKYLKGSDISLVGYSD